MNSLGKVLRSRDQDRGIHAMVDQQHQMALKGFECHVMTALEPVFHPTSLGGPIRPNHILQKLPVDVVTIKELRTGHNMPRNRHQQSSLASFPLYPTPHHLVSLLRGAWQAALSVMELLCTLASVLSRPSLSGYQVSGEVLCEDM